MVHRRAVDQWLDLHNHSRHLQSYTLVNWALSIKPQCYGTLLRQLSYWLFAVAQRSTTLSLSHCSLRRMALFRLPSFQTCILGNVSHTAAFYSEHAINTLSQTNHQQDQNKIAILLKYYAMCLTRTGRILSFSMEILSMATRRLSIIAHITST